jgi:hypothetical protein
LTVKPQLVIEPDYLISEGTNYYAAPGHSAFFPHEVMNSSNFDDVADLTYAILLDGDADGDWSNAVPVSWTVIFWSDLNCDGNIADGQQIIGTDNLAPNGGTDCIVSEVQIPDTVADGVNAQVTVTATSRMDPSVFDTALEEIKISLLVPCEDGFCVEPNTNYTFCDTVYINGYSFVPQELYVIRWFDPDSVEVQTTTVIADGLGELSDSYTFTATDVTGVWTITIEEQATGIIWQTINITLEPDLNVNTIDPFRTAKMKYELTDHLTVLGTLNNTNQGGDFEDTTYNKVVLANDDSVYWDGTSFQPYTGVEWSRTLDGIDVPAGRSWSDAYTFANITFPQRGLWKIKGQWTACAGGYVIAEATFVYMVGITLGTYSDDTFTVEQSSYAYADPVYVAGDHYFPDTDYVLAYYDCSGRLMESFTVTTDGSGYLSLTQDTSGWDTVGTVHVVLYLAGHTPPATFDPDDSDMLETTDITITIEAGADETVCERDGPFDLSGSDPTGGSWSGTGITDAANGTFDPSAAGPGDHTITYTYTTGNGCSASDTKTVTVRPMPAVEAGPDEITWSGADPFNLGGNTPAGGSWSGPGIVDPVNGTFDTGAAGVGSHAVDYSYTAGNGCSDSDTKTVRVDDAWLLRNDQITFISPLAVPLADIFNFRPHPDDPALSPMDDLEQVDFHSGDPFPHDQTDLLPSASVLIFYELTKEVNTMRVSKTGGARIVITF